MNRYETEKGEVFVKKQCMHCWQPACAAACLTNAMHKTKEGPVIWRSDKVHGLPVLHGLVPVRHAEVRVRLVEPENPEVRHVRRAAARGVRKPACVEACPTDALMFGKKRELIEVARVRVYNHPTQIRPEDLRGARSRRNRLALPGRRCRSSSSASAPTWGTTRLSGIHARLPVRRAGGAVRAPGAPVRLSLLAERREQE